MIEGRIRELLREVLKIGETACAFRDNYFFDDEMEYKYLRGRETASEDIARLIKRAFPEILTEYQKET